MTERAERIRGMLTNVETWNPFCHGTSSRFEQTIREQGLRPRVCDGEVCRPSVYEGKIESRPDRVYVARLEPSLGTCMSSASKAAGKFGGEAEVFGVRFKRVDEPQLDMDEDAELEVDRSHSATLCKEVFKGACSFSEELFRSSYLIDKFPKIVSDEILRETHENGCFTDEEREMICSDLPKWVLSLISWWTVAYRGELPSERLSGPEPVKSLYAGEPGEKEALKRLREW